MGEIGEWGCVVDQTQIKSKSTKSKYDPPYQRLLCSRRLANGTRQSSLPWYADALRPRLSV
jgi:hypothetical protein